VSLARQKGKAFNTSCIWFHENFDLLYKVIAVDAQTSASALLIILKTKPFQFIAPYGKHY